MIKAITIGHDAVRLLFIIMNPSYFRHKRVAVDFDGTLFEDSASVEDTFLNKTELQVKPHASESSEWLKKQGFEILIFTCRPDYHRQYLEAQLRKNRISFDYILFYTKPRVDLYIDDKGFRFENWNDTKKWIEARLLLEQGKVVSEQPDTAHEKLLRKEKIKHLDYTNFKSVLDVGCGDGNVWEGVAIGDCIFDAVEPDPNLRQQAMEKGLYRKLFHDISEANLAEYDCVTILGVLEHVDDDKAFLANFAAAKRIYATVPNANSFHRYFGKHLGMLRELTELKEHDFAIGHQRYYTYDHFNEFITAFCETNAFAIRSFGTTSFKISSNAEMAFFRERIPFLNAAAEELQLIGEKNKYGAEIYAYIEKQ